MTLTRQFWVIVHRWAGLTIALFLTVAGATGTFLAFFDELDALLAPQMHIAAPPAPGAAMLDPLTLRDRLLAAHPGGTINYLPLIPEPGRSLRLSVDRIDHRTGALQPWSPDWDELSVNPYTGEILGYRQWGDIGQGMVNLMPFVYRLHYSLALGKTATLAFGIAALIWTIDCFIGFYLTFPVRLKQREGQAYPATSWRSRWKPSWLVRWKGGPHRLTVDLHRAGGLWIWPLLLVFAWSSVAFNLTQVHDPVMKLFGFDRLADGIVPPPAPRHAPKLDFRAAAAAGERLARQEAARRGLVIVPEKKSGLYHRPNAGVYSYAFSSSADFRTHGGRSIVLFDSDTGRLLKLVLPQGQNGANTFTEWVMSLHMAAVWGLPYRIAVSLIGLMVTMLSITGVIIWMRKRSARIAASRTRRERKAGVSSPAPLQQDRQGLA